jgi:catechol 2,3-dioxygenase-like lactoylglutathione lyase family enzyme
MSVLTTAKAITFILTRDSVSAKSFYEDTLGLHHVRHDGFADVFDAGHAILRVTQIADHNATPHPVLGWEVADIVLVAHELIAKGVTLTVYDGFGQDSLGIWTSPDGKTKVAWFTDPDGNVLSLTQC